MYVKPAIALMITSHEYVLVKHVTKKATIEGLLSF